MKDICAPLLRYLPVKVFEYSRVYPNGARCELCTHEAHLENAFLTQKHMSETYTPSLISEDAKWIIVENWISTTPTPWRNKLEAHLTTQRAKLGIGNELTIIERHEQFTEYFHFYCDAAQAGVTSLLLNKFHLLEHFILYFRSHAHDLIAASTKDPLIKPWITKATATHQVGEIKQGIHIDEVSFVAETQPKQLVIQRGMYQEILTKHELICAKYYVKGWSAKEIADSLSVSSRTIETHIANLKQKLGYHRKTELINELIAMNINKLI
jgi:DNA-binding CsgD family transcriptional regulator